MEKETITSQGKIQFKNIKRAFGVDVSNGDEYTTETVWKITKWHMEGEIRVIDEMELVEMSIIP